MSLPLVLPIGFTRYRFIFTFVFWVFASGHVLHAQYGLKSAPHILANKDSLYLATSEEWDGKDTQIGVDVMLSVKGDATPRRIFRKQLVQTPFNLKLLFHDGVFPAIISVVEQDDSIAILYSAMAGGTIVDGHYLVLDRAGDNGFLAASELDLNEFLPSPRAAFSIQPAEVRLDGLRGIHIVHADQFTVDISVSTDNVVTINGKSCAPVNAPIKRLDYRSFLHALSPETDRTYADESNPKPILWWGKNPPSPPFRFQDLLQMSQVIDWVTPPAIDPATAPDSFKMSLEPKDRSEPLTSAPGVRPQTSKPAETSPSARKQE